MKGDLPEKIVMTEKYSLIRLFFIFMKIGAVLLGGGYVILPVVTEEFTNKRNLVPQEDIISYFALSQSLPGIIAANISMFIGYRLCGKTGAVVAMIGITFVPFFCIVFLASLLGILMENSYIQGAFRGIGVSVTALIVLTVREMWQKSVHDLFFYIIFAASLAALVIFRLSPVKTILIFTLLGVFCKKIIRNKGEKE